MVAGVLTAVWRPCVVALVGLCLIKGIQWSFRFWKRFNRV